jgi:hypothetical protein
MQRAFADRLIDFCDRNAEKIADQWYKALSINPRTKSYRLMSKEGCLRHATFLFRNLGQMYFAESCDNAVARTLDTHGFVEDHFARGIPLNEIIYALILMRRHIWLCAEAEILYYSSEDMIHAVDSINRVLLVFDYAVFEAAYKYAEISSKTGKVMV